MVIVALCQADFNLPLDFGDVPDDGVGAGRKLDLGLTGVELLGEAA